MAFFASTFTFETKGRGVFSGIIAWINQVWDRADRIFTPPHVNVVEGRPSADSYTNRLYVVGGFTRNILIDEDFRCLTQGILPPDIVPSVAVGAGAVIQLAYLRYYDEITGERSPLSRSKSYTGDENRAWTNLPTDVPGELTVVEGTTTVAGGIVTGVASNYHDLRPGDRIASAADLTRWAQIRQIISATLMTIDDTTMAVGAGGTLVCKPVSRVSHVEGWISANGTLPRFDFRVRIGTTAYSESIPALALGEADVDTFEAMPHGSMNVVYNDRHLVAGVQGRLDTLFLSAIGFPERYEGLSFRTDAGEEIVGLLKDGTVVIALTRYPSAYRLQGYTEDDLDFQVFAPGMGGLGHHGNQIAANGIAFIPGREQIQTFNGAFHGAMPTRQPEWARAYRENQIAFEMGIGAVDPEGQTYRFAPFPLRLSADSFGLEGPDENPEIARIVYFAGTDPDTFIMEIDFAAGGDGAAAETLHRIGAVGGADPSYNVSSYGITARVLDDNLIYFAGVRFRVADNFDRQVALQVSFGSWRVREIDFTAFANTPNAALSSIVADPILGAPNLFVLRSMGSGTPATTIVYSVIGGIVTVEDTVSSAPANSSVFGVVFKFNGSVYTLNMLTDGVTSFNTNKLRKRASLASWGNVTMPAAPVLHSGFSCLPGIEYLGNCYLFGSYNPGGSPTVLRIDPSDVVSAVYVGVGSFTGFTDVDIHSGILYFITDAGHIGSFDGSTWIEDVFAGFGNVGGCTIRSDGVNLWATMIGFPSGFCQIWKSNGADVTSWKRVHTTSTPGLILNGMMAAV